MNPNAEPPLSVERFSVGKSVARLGNQNDAVCDGKTVKLQALGRKSKDSLLNSKPTELRNHNASLLSEEINNLKKPGSTEPLFDKAFTNDGVLSLHQMVDRLSKGRFSGLLVNIQAAKNDSSNASSIGMIAFIRHLSMHDADTTMSQKDILKGAHAAVKDVYAAMNIPGEPSFAAALLNDNGEMISIHSADMAVAVANKIDVKRVVDDPNSAPQKNEVKQGDRIILCNLDGVAQIRKDEEVENTVDALSKSRDAEREEKPIAENIINTRHATFFPDLHGGKDLNDPKRKGTDSPLTDFVKNPREGELYVSLGDIFDRGPKSWQAAELMTEMVMKGEAVWNWGNHELLFMATMSGDKATSTPENAQALETWFVNGGFELAKGAGVDMKVFNDAVTAAGGNEALFSNAAARKACLAQMLPLIRADKNLQALSGVLEKHGKAYTIVDNVLGTHAGFLANPDGTLMDVMIGTANFGKGLNAMDAIQKEIRNGNPDVINWLANHGGDDTLNKDNPFWVREENFQNVLKDPKTASALRAELNKQLPPDQQIELIVVGHTPMADVVKGTIPLNGAPPAPRFLFADTGYCDSGDPRAVRLEVKSDKTGKKGDSVEVIYIDPVTGKEVESSPGISVLHTFYPTGKNLPRRIAHSVAGESVHAENSLGSPIKKDPLKPNEPIILPDNKRYVDVEENPISVADYIKTKGYEEYKKWIETVIDEINNSTSPDPDVVALKKGATEDPLIYTKRVVQALKEHLSEEGKNKDSDISRIAKEAEVAAKVTTPNRAAELVTLDAVANILNAAPGLYNKDLGPTEFEGTAEAAQAAFTAAFKIYKEGMDSLVTQAKTDPGSLNQAQKEAVAQFLYTQLAYEEAQKPESKDSWQFKVDVRTNGKEPKHFVYEGIPVEGVIGYLEVKMAEAQAAKNDADVAKYTQLRDTLKNNSELYEKIPLSYRREEPGPKATKFTKIDQLMEARHQLEAKERSFDKLRQNRNSNDVDRMQGDWDQGVKDMSVRRELYLKEGEQPDLGTVKRKREEVDAGTALEALSGAPRPRSEPTNEDDVDDHGTAPITSKKIYNPDDFKAVDFAIAKEDKRGIHNDSNIAEHAMSSREQGANKNWGIVKGLTGLPYIGTAFKVIFDPLQYFWRNGMVRDMTKEQWRRSAKRMDTILKSHFIGGPNDIGKMQVPVELTRELFDDAIAGGKKLFEKKGPWSRFIWKLSDVAKKITNVSSTSEMHFAEEWLAEELVKNKLSSPEYNPRIRAVYLSALQEQDAVASRIAKGGAGLRKGEVRKEITNAPLQNSVKNLIKSYFVELQKIDAEQVLNPDLGSKQRKLDEAQKKLVVDVNNLGRTINKTGGGVDLSDSIELASNILSVVKDLSADYKNSGKTRWQILQDEKKWDEFRINIITAESRWGAEGGADTDVGIMGTLREKLLKDMARKELFKGEAERGSALWLTSLVSEVGAYALGAYTSIQASKLMVASAAGGAIIGVGVVGATIATGGLAPVIGGTLGLAGMAAAKEMGGRVGGKQLWRGRYRGEVAQVSREMALGKTKDAPIRNEMRKALVKAVPAQTYIDKIEPLLNPETKLSEAQAYQLLSEIAQLDARMRIADISGKKELQFTVQNYIIYDELNRNSQYLHLKSNILDGLQKLSIYKDSHPDFGGVGTPIETQYDIDRGNDGTGVQYGKEAGDMGIFKQFSLLSEAQLRFGSHTEVLKWLQETSGGGIGMGKVKAEALVNNFLKENKELTAEDESIRAKERELHNLTRRSGLKVFALTALMAPINSAIYGTALQGVMGIPQELAHGYHEGFSNWSNEWHDVWSGIPPAHPPTIYQNGMLTLQDAISSLQHSVEVVAAPAPPHEEVINGVHVTLPGRYKYEPSSLGMDNDRIIDLADGHVVQDLSNVGLHVNESGQLVTMDGAGQYHALSPEFASSPTGVAVPEALFIPTGKMEVSTIDGQTVQIPEGTNWLPNADGSHNLVSNSNPNVILVEHAHVTDGHIVATSYHNGVTPTTSEHSTPGVATPSAELNNSGETSRFDEVAGKYGYGFAHKQGTIYDYKGTNTQGDATLTVKAGGDSFSWHGHDGQDHTMTMNQIVADGSLRFAVQIPGHGTILVPPNADMGGLHNALNLDPADNTHSFTLENGQQMTYGELARTILNQEVLKQTPNNGSYGVEWNHHTDALNLKPDGREYGTINAVYVANPNHYTYHGPTTSTGVTDGTEMNGSLIAIAAIRGTSPAGTVVTQLPPPLEVPPPTITHENIITVGGPITQDVSTFVIAAPPAITPPQVVFPPVILLPLPGRVNVEAAEAAPISTVIPSIGQNQTTRTSSPSRANEAELSEEEKKKIIDEVDLRPYVIAPAMMKVLDLEQGRDFGSWDEAKRGATTKRHKDLGDALIAYEDAKRSLDCAIPANKKGAETRYKERRAKLVLLLKGREGKMIGSSAFNEGMIANIDTLIEEKKEEAHQTALQTKIKEKQKVIDDAAKEEKKRKEEAEEEKKKQKEAEELEKQRKLDEIKAKLEAGAQGGGTPTS